MGKKNQKCYNHIVGNEIVCRKEPHKYEGRKWKKIDFANILVNKLKEQDENNKDKLQFGKFNENEKKETNIFKITIDSKEYLFFIEHTDNGGKKRSKKIQITNNKTFWKLIDEKKMCLIINIYAPYRKDNLELDYSNIIFFVIDPDEIIESEVRKTRNPSSRWVRNEEILNIIQSENKETFYWNNMKNVYIIHCTKIYEFFKSELPKIYNKTLELDLKLETEEVVKTNEITQGFRQAFRATLLYYFNKCQVKNCDISMPEMLVASHIKPVNKILKDNKSDKEKELNDKFNGFLLCANHDKLFDRFLMTVEEDRKIIVNNELKTKYNSIFLKTTLESSIEIEDISKYEKYLRFHRNEFKIKKIN